MLRLHVKVAWAALCGVSCYLHNKTIASKRCMHAFKILNKWLVMQMPSWLWGCYYDGTNPYTAALLCQGRRWKSGKAPDLVSPKAHVYAVRMHVWLACSKELRGSRLNRHGTLHCIIMHKNAACMIVQMNSVCTKNTFLRSVMKHVLQA